MTRFDRSIYYHDKMNLYIPMKKIKFEIDDIFFILICTNPIIFSNENLIVQKAIYTN